MFEARQQTLLIFLFFLFWRPGMRASAGRGIRTWPVFVLGVLLCICLLAHVSMFAAAKDTEPEKGEAGSSDKGEVPDKGRKDDTCTEPGTCGEDDAEIKDQKEDGKDYPDQI
jgi:hypothetical protein